MAIENNPISLNDTDILLLQGIDARERELTDKHIVPFQQALQRTLRLIEQGHGLPVGTIGTTHVVDKDRHLIIPTPHPSAPAVSGPEATSDESEGNDA